MNAGDFVKVKTSQRGRPRKWIVERVSNMDGTATVLAFDSSGDRMEVSLLDITPYPVKREKEDREDYFDDPSNDPYLDRG